MLFQNQSIGYVNVRLEEQALNIDKRGRVMKVTDYVMAYASVEMTHGRDTKLY